MDDKQEGARAALLTDDSLADGQKSAAPARADDAKRTRYLLISFILMIFVGLANRILNIMQYKPMGNYPLTVNLLTTFAYLPTCLLYVVPMAKYRPDIITPEARAVPQRVWLIMGTLDSLAGVMQSFATAYLSADGALIVLLLQSAIPSSMIITKFFLKSKYKGYQYFGAALVIVGILVVLVPQLVQGVAGVDNLGVWAAVLVLSCVPMCLSSVYKEKALGDTEIDPVYMNFWVAVYQFLISIPLLIPMAYASQPPLTVSTVWQNVADGFKCYVGTNAESGDNCTLGPVFVNTYIIANLGYNLLIILLLKYGSSNILWLCMTLQVPIANFAFAIPGIPGYAPASWENGLGLVIIMAGLVIYRFFPVLRPTLARWLPFLAAAPGVSIGDGKMAAGTTINGEDGPLLSGDPEAPSPSGIGGSTPIRGMHTHVAMGGKGKAAAAKKAEALAAARAKLAGGDDRAPLGGRARGDSR